MTWAGEHFMDFEDHVLQERLGALLRTKARYRRDGAKHLASDIGCTERTAKNILSGHWPRANHLRRIVMVFGQDAWRILFAPDLDAEKARLQSEVRELERQLEERRAALRQADEEAEPAGPSAPQALAVLENRAACMSREHASP